MYTAPSPLDEPTTHRLERPLDELVPAPVGERMRRLRLALMVGGAIGLIPGIVFLVITLPANYVALGFDVLLVAFMVTTAVLVFLRRQLALLTAFTTGVLLICDAGFDVMTAGPHDLWVSALTATLVELPLAVILITLALRIFAAESAHKGIESVKTSAAAEGRRPDRAGARAQLERIAVHPSHATNTRRVRQ
jgi:hypothetical protein